MTLIDDGADKKSSGKTDGDSLIAAAEGHQLGQPARPDVIDPETRDVVETVYIRKVEKVDGKLVNVDDRQFPEREGPVQGSDEQDEEVAAAS